MSVLKKKVKIFQYFIFFILIFQIQLLFGTVQSDSLSLSGGKYVKKSIFDFDKIEHSVFYNKLWGMHYRNLYFTPVLVPSANLSEVDGGLSLIEQVPQIYGVLMQNKAKDLRLLRVLGHSATFTHSSFFRDLYDNKKLSDTYLENFLSDAYTITNPFSFVIVDKLASDLSLASFNPKIYYLPKSAENDTIADGTDLGENLVAIYDLGKYKRTSKLLTTNHVLRELEKTKTSYVDQQAYIRERLLDMLVGDWNKVPENWLWYEHDKSDSIVFEPIVLERTQAFTKADGLFFKSMLNVLNLGSITNYTDEFKDLKKSNGLGLALDAALTVKSDKEEWVRQAVYIENTLTDDKIEAAFNLVPKEVRSDNTYLKIKENLIKRRSQLIGAASAYYDILQETPLLTGTMSDDKIVVDQLSKDSLRVQVYSKETDSLILQKEYNTRTKNLWIYGLGGDDTFIVKGDRQKSKPLLLIGGKGQNDYKIEDGSKVKVYDYDSHDKDGDVLSNARVILSDIDGVHKYDYQKLTYSNWDFTPMGIFDSDLGVSLGVYLTYTMYGFKRAPYTYKHMFGYDYLEGFSYVGFFPSLDGKFNLILQANSSTPHNFYNFFGFGNNTPSYKDKKNTYNQVKVNKYSFSGSLYWKLGENHQLVGYSSLELFHLKDKYKKTRLINEYYGPDDDVFRNNIFWDLDLSYEISRKLSSIFPNAKFSATTGWTLNLTDVKRSFPYLKSSASVDVKFTDRITLATQINAEALFTDKYEFYQAATINLRGYRDNRFIGKQSFYQYTDLRYDLGRLENPFTPILYGVFIGFDYGRVWHPEETSRLWHTSLGGGGWLTFFKKYTGKFSYFRSKDGGRFYIGLGLGF